MAETKQFPLTLGYAITVHKSQGSTLAYMQGDLNRSTDKKTATGKNYQQSISQGQFYTLLSRAKSRNEVLLLNFEPEEIKVNESALDELVRMRNESLFSWQHPLIELTRYSNYSSLFCFTETNINDSPAKHIDEILDDWKDIHKNTEHGLALSYDVSKVNIIEVIKISSVLEVLPIVLEIERETILLLMVYCSSWFFHR